MGASPLTSEEAPELTVGPSCPLRPGLRVRRGRGELVDEAQDEGAELAGLLGFGALQPATPFGGVGVFLGGLGLGVTLVGDPSQHAVPLLAPAENSGVA